jgi:Zn-dependent protease
MQPELIFGLIILIVSVILHEVAHGYMADYLGDPTARLAGRLTLNPLPHIDLMGSIIIPIFLALSGSPILLGWAKPVPINPYYLTGKYDEALTAAAGPATNIFLALLFSIFIRALGADPTSPLIGACSVIVLINLSLAFFNLIPIPPIDGSRVLALLLPGSLGRAYDRFRIYMERLGIIPCMLLLLCVFYFFAPYYYAWLLGLFHLLTGITL